MLQRALEFLLILHADHEQNCSSSAVRGVGSSQVDPFSAVSAGIAALYGPLHGGANEAVLKMLDEIGDKKNVPAFIEQVKAGHGRLMGFGHRIYKSYDPRATLVKQTADDVFAETGLNPKLEIALELERIALEDDYFVSRKLYPNVDFYSGLIYQAMGYPPDYFTVLFALGRLPGWIAQWEEMLTDPEQKIARPRQIYVGADKRDFVPMDAAAAGTRRRRKRDASGVYSDDGRSTPRYSAAAPHPRGGDRRRPADARPVRAAAGHLRRLHRERPGARLHRGLRPRRGAAALRQHAHRGERHRAADDPPARGRAPDHPRRRRR